MRRRALFVATLLLAGCPKRSPPSIADAAPRDDAATSAGVDAEPPAPPGPSFVAVASTERSLELQAPAGGPVIANIDNLFFVVDAEGVPRAETRSVDDLPSGPARFFVGGIWPDAYVSRVALREETLGWRRRDGAYLSDPKASTGVVRRVVRWTDGRLVTLRFYEPLDVSLKAQSTRTDTFEVLSGPALKALPRIPEGYLVDDFAAAPDGPLVAIGARASDTGGVRDAGYLFTWEPGQTAPVVAKLPGVEGEGRVPVLLRSSSGELYVAGAAACARHGDGGPWCPVVLHAGKDLRFRSIEAPFDAPVVSASLADDGTLWVISGALVREDAVRGPRSVWSLSDGKTWRRITMPSSPIAAGTRRPHWVVDTLYPPTRPDVPSEPLEPVALVARRADDIWMVGEHRGGQAGFVRYLLHTEAPRSIADLEVPDDYQVFRDNVKPAPVADARCTAQTFVLGPNDTTIERRARETLATNAALRAAGAMVLVGRVHDREVVAVYVSNTPIEIQHVREEVRAAFPSAPAHCRRPVVDHLVGP